MKSPKDRYENDSTYHACVDMMESLIHKGNFTPSEMREMAVLASIHHELRYGIKHYTVPLNVSMAFDTLTEWRNKDNSTGTA